MRLGYVLALDRFIDAFARLATGPAACRGGVQKEGYFEAHIRHIRGVYAERRAALLDALHQELPGLCLQLSDQGMHLVPWLPEGLDDLRVAAAAGRAGIALQPLSPCARSA